MTAEVCKTQTFFNLYRNLIVRKFWK